MNAIFLLIRRLKFAVCFLMIFTLINRVEAQQLSSKYQLIQHLYSDGLIYFVYPAGDPNAGYLKQIASKMAHGSKELKLIPISDLDLTHAEASGHALFLVGSATNNRYINQIASELPIQFSEKGFIINHQSYEQNAYLKISLYPSPFNPEFPMLMFTGPEEKKLPFVFNTQYGSKHLYSIMSAADFEIIENNSRKIMGFFNSEEDENWSIDTSRQWIFDQAGKQLGQSTHFTFIGHQLLESSGDRIKKLREMLESGVGRIEHFSHKIIAQKYLVNLYPDAETKGMMTGISKAVHVGTDQEIYMILNEEYDAYESALPYELILKQVIGKASSTLFSKGLSVWMTAHWQKKGYRYWAGRLNAEHNYLSLETLTDDTKRKSTSPLIVACLSGVMTGLLLEKLGQETFLNLYKHGPGNNFSIRLYEAAWCNYMQALAMKISPDSGTSYADKSFQKGFNFAHEGYQIYNGYLSESANKSLAKLSAMGANSAAIIPYSIMRSPDIPTAFPFAKASGSENDESIIHVLVQGHKNGLRIMLKPQIWLWSSWPGDIEMENEDAWDAWFNHYYRWIIHYALIAEIRHADIFCIGTELTATTLTHPDKWKALIKKIRGIYHGPIVYSANWGEEFENIRFWQVLDYAGISCYYPLSNAANPDNRELEHGAEKIARKLEKVSKANDIPILITEIGYRSVPAVWKEPWNHQQNSNIDYNAQSRSYQAIISALDNKLWLAGIYWWKWPAYLPHGIREQTGYTPVNKPAEKIVFKWFRSHL